MLHVPECYGEPLSLYNHFVLHNPSPPIPLVLHPSLRDAYLTHEHPSEMLQQY